MPDDQPCPLTGFTHAELERRHIAASQPAPAKLEEAGTEFFPPDLKELLDRMVASELAIDAAELAMEPTGAEYAELLGPDWREGCPF